MPTIGTLLPYRRTDLPTYRPLRSETHSEHPEHRHICTALDNLAGKDVVGVWSRFPEFRSVLADVLGADVIGQDEPEIFEKVQEVRELLAGIGIVSDLLEHDLNLYAHASQAINVGLDGL